MAKKRTFAEKCGIALGTMAGAIEGFFATPKTEATRRNKRNKEGRAALKAKRKK